jgi:DNA-binding PadR family transcriptional regulator
MEGISPRKPTYLPATPMELSRLDIPEGLLIDLMVRRTALDGTVSLGELGAKLKLAPGVLYPLFQQLRKLQYIEVTGMNGDDYVFTLTSAGRSFAQDRFLICQYAGPAPVSLNVYSQAVKKQQAKVKVNRDKLKEVLSDLVVTDELLDQLGPAVVSQSSIFLYGPSGNGKTSMMERLHRVYGDAVVVPYAIEVDNQIIVIYDPALHHKIDYDEPRMDQRWVVCRRPYIVVGGELEPSMLELKLDQSSKVYAAPMQLKANNGIFAIDDFGRQIISPTYLLNRWIVPLDRKVDYLSLSYGMKFQVPFEMMVIFSTNLDPTDLADDAFLRRIQNKIYAEPVQPQVFDEIFMRILEAKGIPYDDDAPHYLRYLCEQSGTGELRACYPGDILRVLESVTAYEQKPFVVTRNNIDRAGSIYFARTQEVTVM